MAGEADPPSEARVTTFLMGDIKSSTANWLATPDEMDRALRTHDEIVRTAVDGAGGVVFKHTGDGFLARFDEPGDAVAAGRAVRGGLAALDADVQSYLAVRLAIDTGWATPRDGDWFGPAVNRVARLTDLASETGVVITRAAVETARQRLDVDLLGPVTLKSHDEPTVVFAVDGATVRREASAGASRFPTRLTSFVGRDAERAKVVSLLEVDRLVTILAIGGAGKTRLAISVGESWSGPAGFVDLVPCRTELDVVRALALGIGVDEDGLSGAVGADAFLDHIEGLIGDADHLVVVDNCEHVVELLRDPLTRLLERCPGMRVLATSREALDIAGEHVYPLPMLDVGVRLFAARAAGHGIDLDDSVDVHEAVRALCTRLDGLPLAIELAAARLRDVGLRELVADVDRLMTDARSVTIGGADRHRTMRDMVVWSHRDLAPAAQELFERVSLFEGSFRASDVALLGDVDGAELRTLVRRSLLVQQRAGLEVTYRMLEPVRQVANELLHERGTADAARLALADGLIGRDDGAYGDDWWDWASLEEVRPLLPTAWAIIDWLAARGEDRLVVRVAGRIAGAATVFAGARRLAAVLGERTEVMTSLPRDEQARVLVAYALAGIGGMEIDHTTAGIVALYDMGLEGSPALSFAHRSAALGAMVAAFDNGEDSPFALDMLAVARETAKATGSRYECAAVEAYFGWAHLLAGRWDEVEAVSRAGLDHVAAANVWHMVLTTNLGMALFRQGCHDEALELVRSHPDHGRYMYMGDMLGYVEILALAALGRSEEADATLIAAIDRVLGSTHPGHRSDMALVAAWSAVFAGREEDGRVLVDGSVSTRGPHTLQLIRGLEERLGAAPARSEDRADDVEARLTPRLEAERARAASNAGGVA